MDRRLVFGALFSLTLGLGACSTGGGSVTSPNPLNPTPAGSGTIAPSSAPSSSASASPTPAASASPSPGASPSPTSSAGANCAANDPGTPATVTTPLPPNGGTLTLPNFGDLTGTANAPAIDSSDQQGQTVTIKISNTNFDNVSYASGNTPQTGSPIVFTSLNVSANVMFASSTPMIPTTVTGSCEINAPHTYSVGLYTFGSQTQLVSGIVPNGHAITFTLNVPIQTFPMQATGDVVITQN
jgi:hypothetical protein